MESSIGIGENTSCVTDISAHKSEMLISIHYDC